jgi:DNA-directed RNA polymerase subunit RPC12/RpoP
MLDQFECPKCGASYARDRRRVGKAVVCTCGHKFLVPPAQDDVPTTTAPPASPRRHTPAPRVSPMPRAQPTRRPNRAAPSDESYAEVVPLAEPVEPAHSSATRWADPVDEPASTPLMEAEVLSSDNPYAEPLAPLDDVLAAGDAYADPFAAGSLAPPLRSPPPPPRAAKKGKKKRHRSGDSRPVNFSNWVAYFVLFFILPAAALFTIIGLVQHRRAGGRTAVQVPGNVPTPPSAPSGFSPKSAEPPPSGHPITLWNATRQGHLNEFSVEYRIDRAPLDGTRQYYWVVSDPQGRIEFPIPADRWKQRDKLSGKPSLSAGGQFTGPYTMFIEEQVGPARNRVSNDVPVSSGP